ncbi:MAG: helix-turn-helix transcriptional regulator [bacterium]|nr:helix-turn-helix transcriptional regulator [bacterium]
MKEVKYKDIGIQLRSIRESLKLTLDDLHREIGISRSYVSEFERGLQLPSAKYLWHLHDKYNVNLNYVYCGDNIMFRPTEEEREQWDFGKYQEEVEEMLDHMSQNPHALFAMILKFTEYKIENQKFIDQPST